MNKNIIINSSDITNIIEVYGESNSKYRISTTEDIKSFISQKTEDYINYNNKHALKILKMKKTTKIIDIIYLLGIFLNLISSIHSIISSTDSSHIFVHSVILFSLIFVKCIIAFFINFIEKREETKIQNEILQKIHNGIKMDIFNVHIPLVNANMESYTKLVHLIEKNNIQFPGLIINNEYRPAEELDIRSKIDFLKTIINYDEDNNGISIFCVKV